MQDPDWLEKLFRLWGHGDPVSTLGSTNPDLVIKNPGALYTEDGILGICTTNLGGCAMLVPQAVSDALGYWNEDYGLYGAEDGDYGLRMKCAGFPQYYYSAPDYFLDLGNTDTHTIYVPYGVDKRQERQHLFITREGCLGLFVVNNHLYNLRIRSWKPLRRYRVVDMDEKCRVRLAEREEYGAFKPVLDLCAQKITLRIRAFPHSNIFTPDFIAELRSLLAGVGQDWKSEAGT
jgi:hypothetical protein